MNHKDTSIMGAPVFDDLVPMLRRLRGCKGTECCVQPTAGQRANAVVSGTNAGCRCLNWLAPALRIEAVRWFAFRRAAAGFKTRRIAASLVRRHVATVAGVPVGRLEEIERLSGRPLGQDEHDAIERALTLLGAGGS